ncbi:MAG: glycosyltransferase family 2 protein [Ignavibacteriae bacterium]|nr:glycosyltransferase family 2 protein [Ignavibacteriota bacterium]
MKLSIIIPVYNEKNTIGALFEKVKNVDIEKEIIIVDDCSTDGTKEILSQFTKDEIVRVLCQPKNKGKGFAIRTALQHVTGEVVIIQDADLEYDPNDYKILIKPIVDGVADVVYGSRWLMSHFRNLSCNRFRLATALLTFMANVLYNAKITDEPTCYKVFRTSMLKSLSLKCERFEFCPEVTAKLRKKGFKIYEIPIYYKPRSLKEGKKIRFKDGLAAIWTLIKYRFVD